MVVKVFGSCWAALYVSRMGEFDGSPGHLIRPASGGLRDFVFVNGIAISEDEYARVYAKPKSEEKKVLHECNEYHQGSPYNGVTERGPSVDECISDAQNSEDSKVPTYYEPEFKTLSPGSIYRGPGDQRPLSTKAFDFVRKGAEGIASVSRTAAVEIAKVSWTTSKQVIDKTMELQNRAAPVLAPVLAPILLATIDEGGDQLVVPPDKGSEHEHIQREAPNRRSTLQHFFECNRILSSSARFCGLVWLRFVSKNYRKAKHSRFIFRVLHECNAGLATCLDIFCCYVWFD